jgi:hypothetical protein
MTKYSQVTFNAHEKRVFISVDNKNLCWQNKNSFDFNYVPISDIVSIERGRIGPGVERHVGSRKIKDTNCFVLITTNKNNSIEFGVRSIKVMDKFIDCFEFFLNSTRRKNEQSGGFPN